MAMVRNLRRIGNSCGIIIDRPVLELLNLDVGSPVKIEVAPGGGGLLLTPVNDPDHETRVREASKNVMARHGKAFEKLAQ